MQVVLDASDEVIIKIFIGWRSSRVLSLHYADKILSDLIDLVSSKQVRYLG